MKIQSLLYICSANTYTLLNSLVIMLQAKDIEHVLFHEIDNTNQIIMYLEGEDWCAYERSAFHLFRKKPTINICREVVADGYDVVLVKAFFPMEDLGDILSGLTLKLVADGRLQFVLEERNDGFPEWKKTQLNS